ncbi:Sec63 Brl domain-containing protein [Phakopsora pachyrhizi]|nr:Sec63 Brl domain-containing protein [Phakopsora pachyrhizi]
MTGSLSSFSVHSSTPQKRPSFANSSTASLFIDSPRSQSSVSACAKRSTSTIYSTTPNLPSSVIPSSSMIRTPLYSIQLRAMRIQSLALQLSSLTTKFHTLNCSIIPTSNTLDQLINSGLHIPVIFLDEQDRLEAAGQEMNSGETIKFYLALMDQYKESDEIWFDQRTLEAEIDGLRRDVDFQISSTRLSIDRFNSIRAKLDPILSQQSTQKARIEGNARVLAPRSKKFLDQSELNQSIILNLCLGSDWVQSSLNGLTEGVRLYKHWELLDSECLKTRTLQSTELGKIASKLYIKNASIEIFKGIFRSKMSGADILAVISESVEFDQIKVRESEAEELEQLEKEAPCQVEGGPTSTPGKVNILLQAYISRLHIEDFALISDTAYVVQNAARIARALVDIGVWKKLADTACVMIEMAKCIDKRKKQQQSSVLFQNT